MKIKFSFILFLLASLVPAFATDLSTTVSTDYVSTYAFRGEKVQGPSVQPALNVQYGDVYANVWASRPVTHNASGEVDLSLGATCQLGFDGGLTAYTYPGASRTTWEPYVGWGTEVDRLKASVYAYRDLTLLTTSYEGKLSVKAVSFHGFDLSLDGSLGRVQSKGSAYSYWTAGPTVSYKLGKDLTVSDSFYRVSSSDLIPGRVFWTNRVGFSLSF